jgi:hypothetical protein
VFSLTSGWPFLIFRLKTHDFFLGGNQSFFVLVDQMNRTEPKMDVCHKHLSIKYTCANP